MGTSNSFGGPNSGTPLVPTWLEPDNEGPETDALEDENDQSDDAQENQEPNEQTQAPADANRFMAARANFSRFARSGGNDRASLGRAISRYVSTSSGGAQKAARRIGAARTAGSRLLGVLSSVIAQGAREALRALNLENLAGRPIREIFLGLVDYICPDGGTINVGIARESFIETIASLAENGITDFTTLTTAQVQTVFELYTTHTIEARLYNDIRMKVIRLPSDVRVAKSIQDQLFDFVHRSVADAFTVARMAIGELTVERIQGLVDEVYERAFAILQSLGEAEASV